MRGSLDNPPIVITASYWKTLGYLLISAGFVAVGGWMIYEQDLVWLAGFFTAFFGAGALLCIFGLLAPPTLTLTPDGISWFTGFKTVRYTWREIHSFRSYRVFGTSSRMVGFDFAEDYPKYRKARRLSRKLTGVEGAFGMGWTISEASLAELLNTARARWFVE